MNIKFFIIIFYGITQAACSYKQVSFKSDVTPIINDKCIQCHTPPDGSGYKKTGLAMHSYQHLIQGSVFGPVIISGDSKRSVINMLVEGRAGNVQRQLHDSGKALTNKEVEVFKLWVEQGALDN